MKGTCVILSVSRLFSAILILGDMEGLRRSSSGLFHLSLVVDRPFSVLVPVMSNARLILKADHCPHQAISMVVASQVLLRPVGWFIRFCILLCFINHHSWMMGGGGWRHGWFDGGSTTSMGEVLYYVKDNPMCVSSSNAEVIMSTQYSLYVSCLPTPLHMCLCTRIHRLLTIGWCAEGQVWKLGFDVPLIFSLENVIHVQVKQSTCSPFTRSQIQVKDSPLATHSSAAKNQSVLLLMFPMILLYKPPKRGKQNSLLASHSTLLKLDIN